MFPLSHIGRIGRSHSYSLWQDKGSLCVLGAPLFSKRDTLKLVRLSWVKKEKGVSGCSFVPLLDNLEGKEQQDVR